MNEEIVEKLTAANRRADFIGLARLLREARQNHQFTQAELASVLPMSQSCISNIERLLNLPPIWIKRVEAGVLPCAHARDLVRHRGNRKLLRMIERKYFPTLRRNAVPIPPAKEFHEEVKRMAKKLEAGQTPKRLVNQKAISKG